MPAGKAVFLLNYDAWRCSLTGNNNCRNDKNLLILVDYQRRYTDKGFFSLAGMVEQKEEPVYMLKRCDLKNIKAKP